MTVLAGMLLALLLLATGEVIARLVDPRNPVDLNENDYTAWSYGPCYRVRGTSLERIAPPGFNDAVATAWPRPPIPLAKTPGVLRIALVGESTGVLSPPVMVGTRITVITGDQGPAR
jgi:hypothetical protein